MLVIAEPSENEVEKYLKEWSLKENFILQEESLNKLFLKISPKNNNLHDILIKTSCLNDFYSTHILSTVEMAKHIYSLNIDKRLNELDETLVNDIAKTTIGEKTRNFYSFASKYCSHHFPEHFPIYDSYVEKVLMYFKKKDNFAEFKREDLKDYSKFKEVVIKFKRYYNINKYNLKEIDMYIWQLGKEYFKNIY